MRARNSLRWKDPRQAQFDSGVTAFLLEPARDRREALNRVAEMTAFFSLQVEGDGSRHGILVEYDSTEKIFTQPSDERTEGYVTGRFG